MAYTTKEAVKSYLKIPDSNSAEDDLLDTLVLRAQARIDMHCNQSFEALANTTRYFSSLSIEEGGAVAVLDLLLDAPLCAITSVVNGDGSTVSAGNYTLLPLNGTPKFAIRLKRSSGLFWTYDDDVESDLVAVSGKWAYSVSAPADIEQACTRLAAWYYRQRANANDLDRTVITAGQTILPSRLPQDVMDTLNDGYVRRVMSGVG